VQIRLISFDLDNTLWDTPSVLIKAAQGMQEWISKEAPAYDRLSTEKHREIHTSVYTNQPELVHDLSQLRLAVLTRTFEVCGYSQANAAQLAHAAFGVFYQLRQQVVPYPEADPLLAKLSTRYRIVSITNGNADASLSPLGKYFDFNITAAMVGEMKPAPEPFVKATELTNVKPAESVHIGDSLKDDVEGARNAGFTPIWFNEQGEESPNYPVATVSNLKEIVGLLEQLEAG